MAVMIPNNFRTRLQRMRLWRNFSVVDLAKRAKMNRLRVERLEVGRWKPVLASDVVKLAKALRVSTDWLLGVGPNKRKDVHEI